jgi:predicted alpha/beta-fold hydrolase
MAEPSNRLYNRHFTRRLQKAVDAHHARFADLLRVTWPLRLTLQEFDRVYTALQHGFRDAQEYYQHSSAAPLLQSIRIPCAILLAADDPMVDTTIFEHIVLPPQVRLVCTPYGGHLGFLGLPGSACGYRAMDTQVLAWIAKPV